MIANYEKSKEEQEATVRMFCTYCWKSLLNARKDIARRQERRAKRVRLFCDMRESELNRLTCPACGHCFESLFDVGGVGVTVADPDMADAIRALDADGQAIVLLHYFAEWHRGRRHPRGPRCRRGGAGTLRLRHRRAVHPRLRQGGRTRRIRCGHADEDRDAGQAPHRHAPL